MKPQDDPLVRNGATTIELRPDQVSLLARKTGARFAYRSPEEDDGGNILDPGYAVVPASFVTQHKNAIDEVTITPAINAVRSEATQQVMFEVDRVGQVLKSGYPQSEVESWSTKDAVAQKIVDGTASTEEAEILQAEADQTGESLEDVAQKVLTNAVAYKKAIGTLTGIRRSAETALKDATNENQAKAIIREATLQAKTVEAEIKGTLEDNPKKAKRTRRTRGARE